MPDSIHDPLKPNIRKLEREIRNELKVLALERPNVAARHLEFLTSKNTDIDYEFSQPPVPPEQIKFYPGSIKGPAPEDDPEAYSRWFYEHQPDALKERGLINIDEMGIKKKLIRGERTNIYTNEIKDDMEYFYEADEEFLGANFERPPEWEISTRSSYSVVNDEDFGATTFTSLLDVSELAP
ncbi:MAG: hypothetical protein ACK521_00460 [bacterium]|jgi:hypothetical protein